MNKQEVIEKIKNLEGLTILDKTINFDSEMISKKEVFNIINQIDEPEKPVVPQFVADWYEKHKVNLPYEIYELCIDYANNGYEGEFYDWFKANLNGAIETLVKMKLYGYEVEKEKLYRARHKLTGEYLSQNYAKTGYYHGLDHFHILKLSKKDWEELGVLDDKVYEIEEAEE